MKQFQKLTMTLLLLITAVASAWAQEATDPKVDITNANTTASFTMPASDVTVNYALVRDMQDATNPVVFSGLPTNDEPIVVKKGDDGNYQPATTLTIKLIDELITNGNQDIIGADGLTIKVFVREKNEQGGFTLKDPKPLAEFLANMQPGNYVIKAQPKGANSPYDGNLNSAPFTVAEKYDLLVKPADDFSKNGLDKVTVGTETIDATTGEAAKTGIVPDTEVKIKAKRGYIIEKVEAGKTVQN